MDAITHDIARDTRACVVSACPNPGAFVTLHGQVTWAHDAMDDSTPDIGGDVRWMTYAEIAVARGISRDSATRLVMRRKWRRQVGNTGIVRVAVPLTAVNVENPAAPDVRDDARGDIASDVVPLIGLLNETLQREREATNREHAAVVMTAQLKAALEQTEQALRGAMDAADAERTARVAAEQARRVALIEAEQRHAAELQSARATDLHLRGELERAFVVENRGLQDTVAAATAELDALRRAEVARRSPAPVVRAWRALRGGW